MCFPHAIQFTYIIYIVDKPLQIWYSVCIIDEKIKT